MEVRGVMLLAWYTALIDFNWSRVFTKSINSPQVAVSETLWLDWKGWGGVVDVGQLVYTVVWVQMP